MIRKDWNGESNAGLHSKAQVLAYMDEGIKPENSYQVLLDEDGDLYWVTKNDGMEVRYDKEPETSFGQRFQSGFIEMLPVQSQL